MTSSSCSPLDETRTGPLSGERLQTTAAIAIEKFERITACCAAEFGVGQTRPPLFARLASVPYRRYSYWTMNRMGGDEPTRRQTAAKPAKARRKVAKKAAKKKAAKKA
jgi:hypothetical protein